MTDIEIKIEAAKKGWDWALNFANNICVQISDEYNNDDDTEKADAAVNCYRTIQSKMGHYPDDILLPEWQATQTPKQVSAGVWVKINDRLPSNKINFGLLVRYNFNGNVWEKELGDSNLPIQLVENGWDDVEWLDESTLTETDSTPIGNDVLKVVEKIRKESGVYIWAYPVTYRDTDGKVEKVVYGWELEWPSGKTAWYQKECSTYEEALNEGIKAYQ